MAYLFRMSNKGSLADRVIRAKSGDAEEADRLILDFQPFILKTVSALTHHYIETENNEEFIVGMEAFNEAVRRYEKSRGEFLKFAAMVISSRIRDLYRKNMHCRDEISLEQVEENEEFVKDTAFKKDDFTKSLEIKNEFACFKEELNRFSITMGELIRACPKHRDTRHLALRIARSISGHKLIKSEMFRKKRLPYSLIMGELSISRKFLTRNQCFIIAAVLILDSELELIKDYITHLEGGDDFDA